MTPAALLKLARERRANYRNGLCDGIAFRDDGTPFRWRKAGSPCLLAVDTPERCTYLEDCVTGTAGAGARSCACGEPLPARRRMCDKCAAKAKKEALRRYRSKKSDGKQAAI